MIIQNKSSSTYIHEKSSLATQHNSVYYSFNGINVARPDLFLKNNRRLFESLDIANVEGFDLICFDNCLESNTNCIDFIYDKFIIKLGIPENKINFIGSSIDYKQIILETANLYNKRPINCEAYLHWEKDSQNYFPKVNDKLVPITRNINNITKKYINFTRVWRKHRIELLNYLYENNLFDVGYNSISNDINHMSSDKLHSDLYKRLPLTIDTNQFMKPLGHNTNGGEQLKLLNFFNSSVFSVVTESNFDEYNVRFLTEKTFKPMIFKHSFILAGQYKSLEYIRQLGYKTFSPYINEDYDNISDSKERLKDIQTEIHRLCSLTKEETIIFLQNVQEIVDHNYQTLLNKQNFLYRVS